jgi:hypothetical protein
LLARLQRMLFIQFINVSVPTFQSINASTSTSNATAAATTTTTTIIIIIIFVTFAAGQ